MEEQNNQSNTETANSTPSMSQELREQARRAKVKSRALMAKSKGITPLGGEESREEIDDITSAFMIVVAICYDVISAGLNFIPVAGNALAAGLGVISFLHFFIWFKIKGINFSKDPKKMLRFFIPNIAELVPVIDTLPGVTTGVGLTLAFIKGKKILDKVPGGNKLVKGLDKTQGKFSKKV
jgi:hypothetical protein